MDKNEKLFFTKLKDIFIGTKVEGDSGFINLMKIKSAYFDTIFNEINKEIDDKTTPFPEFKEELFDRLNSFIKTYFSESGSIYFTYTPLKSKVLEPIYSGQKDVMLFWKTHMLYYVKSQQLFQNLSMIQEIDDVEYEIKFDVSTLQHKLANEKKSLVYEIKNVNKKQIMFSVAYSSGKKTNHKNILKFLKEKNICLDEEGLGQILRVFEKQNKVDFFINSDANRFLKTQFDNWLQNYLFDIESDFNELRLKQLKILREIAHQIIDFIAQFEDELVKIWKKPKFVLNGNYVITLNKIYKTKNGPKFLKKLFSEKEFKNQIQEWDDLSLAKKINPKKIFDGVKLEKEFQYLTIDTKHFSEDIKLDLLSLFENIEKELDGWLIKSENYQALNTLLKKFKNKINCIYIDPPYNAPNSELSYENNFLHSTWLTMIANRIELGKKMLSKSASMVVAIDKHEQERLGLLLEDKFPEYDKTCVTVVHNPGGTQGDNFYYTNEFAYFLTPADTKSILERNLNDDEMEDVQLRKWGGDSDRSTGANVFYPIYVKNGKVVRLGEVPDINFHPKKQIIKNKDEYEVWPIDSSGNEKKWRYQASSLQPILDQVKVKQDGDKIEIFLRKPTKHFKTTWLDTKYVAGDYGTKVLTNMGLDSGFTFPKSIHTVKDCIFSIVGNKKDALILDFFGGSGTTAHSTMMLNKEDGGNRKFIVTEMADYFDSIIVPRIKKIAFTFNWKKGSPQDFDGMDIFFKYYGLEQYEQTLRKTVYEKSNPFMVFDDKSIYQQYVFFKDLKMLDAVKVDAKNNQIKIDFLKIYSDVDIPETLSNLNGKSIKSIEKLKVIFDDGEEIKFDEVEFNLIKSLIWW